MNKKSFKGEIGFYDSLHPVQQVIVAIVAHQSKGLFKGCRVCSFRCITVCKIELSDQYQTLNTHSLHCHSVSPGHGQKVPTLYICQAC